MLFYTREDHFSGENFETGLSTNTHNTEHYAVRPHAALAHWYFAQKQFRQFQNDKMIERIQDGAASSLHFVKMS
jgi:hypothetical protein